jgi:hypothetical protein
MEDECFAMATLLVPPLGRNYLDVVLVNPRVSTLVWVSRGAALAWLRVPTWLALLVSNLVAE